MKKRLYILVITTLLFSGCGINGIVENTETQNESNITSENESVSGADSDVSTTEMPSESESETTEEETQEPTFQITLPEGAVLVGDVFGDGDWIIRREGYIVTEEYPYEGRNEVWTEAGWITLWEGEYWGEGHDPFIPWNHCEMGNYESLSQGYIGEAVFDIYDAVDIYNQNIPEDKRIAECWVLVFADLNGMQETSIHSNWIFLSKKCFTKEEALKIAETFVPAYTE